MATVEEGRDEVVKLIGAGLSGNRFDAVGIGDDDTEVSDSDTGLKSTVDTETGLTASADGNTMSLVATFTDNSATIRESTIYESTDDVCLARQVLNELSVEDSDTVELTWEINLQDV